jgi:hypothetical protein
MHLLGEKIAPERDPIALRQIVGRKVKPHRNRLGDRAPSRSDKVPQSGVSPAARPGRLDVA